VNASASSARNSAAFAESTRVVSLYATQDVYVNFGDVAVTASATDHFFPAGVYYDIALGGGGVAHSTHVAVLRVSADGSVYISEKE
jgi:hypothetical protein